MLGLPVHPSSATWIASIGASKTIWPAFGSLYAGSPNGFLAAYVLGSVLPRVGVSFTYASESDHVSSGPTPAAGGGYSVPPAVPIESNNQESLGDRHALVIDASACRLYELFKVSVKHSAEAALSPDGFAFHADSGAMWDLASNGDPIAGGGARPSGVTLGWTSTDAAGLPIFPGLTTYYEAGALKVLGIIRHALRFTVQRSRAAYLYPPATHYASADAGASLPPMGMRLRL